MSGGQEGSNKLPATPDGKVYGSYKVSEYTHGKQGFKVDESAEIEERKRKKE